MVKVTNVSDTNISDTSDDDLVFLGEEHTFRYYCKLPKTAADITHISETTSIRSETNTSDAGG